MSTKRHYAPLSGEQERALREYRAAFGNVWREMLATDWRRGGSDFYGDFSPLQRLRNTHGPEWLSEVS